MRKGWAICAFALFLGCSVQDGGREAGGVDTRLEIYAVVPSSPTAESAAYFHAIGEIHSQADQAASDAAAVAILRRGLAVPAPAGVGETVLVRLELANRLCETLARQPGAAVVALEVLTPMLAPDRPLPLDLTTARALVTQGDLAGQVRRDDLAVASYARAIRVMSMLREELEP